MGYSESRAKQFLSISKEQLEVRTIDRKKFIILPILAFELIVCSITTLFYQEIGYKFHEALTLAVIVESFYMYFSAKSGVKETFIRILLLGISVLTLSYSSYVNDENIQNHRRNKKESYEISLKTTKSVLLAVETGLNLINDERMKIQKEMDVYVENSLVTKGNKILEPRRIKLDAKERALKNSRSQAVIRLNQLKIEGLHYGNIFTNYKLLTIKSIISILVFFLIQISICFALPDLMKKE